MVDGSGGVKAAVHENRFHNGNAAKIHVRQKILDFELGPGCIVVPKRCVPMRVPAMDNRRKVVNKFLRNL